MNDKKVLIVGSCGIGKAELISRCLKEKGFCCLRDEDSGVLEWHI